MDTSAFVSGVVSSKGAAREILRFAEAGVIDLVISEQVLIETDRVLEQKFPELMDESRNFVRKLRPEVVDDPDETQVRKFCTVIEKKDAPILAAAHLSEVDCLVTWDKKDFLKPKVKGSVVFPIFDPGEFLAAFRDWLAAKEKV